MSKADQLAAKLKQTQHSSADETHCADHQIDSWPAQVYELYHLIETWLAPLSEAGLNIRRVPTHVFERHPDGATYDYAIDQLLIEGNHHSITFDPVARFTEDGAGRVEIRTQGKSTLDAANRERTRRDTVVAAGDRSIRATTGCDRHDRRQSAFGGAGGAGAVRLRAVESALQ